ncbi:MAG: putative glycolipid-binding domain-containing protein [Rhodospirillaceae bacterium]|nr:putative glycolipid-binding domain-containing protein [Rhodospirillaceae bacterium]
MTKLVKLDRAFYWAAADGPGIEQCRLRSDEIDDGYVMHGLALGIASDGREKGKPYRLTYKLKTDAGWCTRKAVLEAQIGDAQQTTRILRSDGKGRWKDEHGDRIEAFDGCIDIDLWATPLTNTLPLRRLALRTGGFKPGGRETIQVLWVTGPTLAMKKAPQHYTLQPPGSSGARALFEDGASDFRAEIALDRDQFVTDYPGLFRRL